MGGQAHGPGEGGEKACAVAGGEACRAVGRVVGGLAWRWRAVRCAGPWGRQREGRHSGGGPRDAPDRGGRQGLMVRSVLWKIQ